MSVEAEEPEVESVERAARRSRAVGTTVLLTDDRSEDAAAERAAEMLRRLEAEPSRFLLVSRPATAAMMAAATRTLAELEARQDDPSRPAIVAMSEKAVLAAAKGSAAHLAIVQDRLEGRAGFRSGDSLFGSGASPSAAQEVASAIEEAVNMMVEARLATPDGAMPERDDSDNEAPGPRDGRIEGFATQIADATPGGLTRTINGTNGHAINGDHE